mmetsp:Transcript_1796/g.4553  ORF Transcript_1796/g.4553 Transcript_1796/m.4553 type:complete len:270 (+) Transcript_1796:111-920(+)|eukprot:CAMPEP_0202341954 /NCGR_PEP_ID=MMETSP1126-20121109/2724_1 /ASSEMBLY_ACC=CAM_ASM_000457 /TAXON_ID=3047 /ORGANISM="Dunaliella tertiolecta, Strain CCMP1320" /LENGTH=269 /DNA_ID=CAMNT_0048932837 /DNA_START=62 /DNA_END=871 /DNA_ORIENTATION=+
MVVKEDDTTLEQQSANQKICVKEGGGFLYQLLLNQKLSYSPEEVWKVLTEPNAPDVFRSIKGCVYRKVLEDDKQGRRKIAVGHEAVARFLFLSFTFQTNLLVWEDDKARTIKFKNAQEGFMKKFDGAWHVQPYSRQAIESSNQSTSHAGQTYNLNWLADVAQRFGPATAQKDASWISLEQSILPRAPAPPGIKQLIKGLCARQLQNMIEDLDAELHRRKYKRAGSPPEASKSQSKSGSASSAASVTMASQQWPDIWENTAPLVNITIKL